MNARSAYSAVVERIRLLTRTTNLAFLRKSMFHVVLLVSGLAVLNGVFGNMSGLIAPERILLVRVMLFAWLGLHGVIYVLLRWRPSIAYFTFCCFGFVVLAVVFDSTNIPPVGRIGAQFLYHSGLIFTGLMLLSFDRFALFSTVATILLIVLSYLTFHSGSLDLFIGHCIPLVVHWGLSLLAAKYVDRYYRAMVESQTRLAQHRDKLEDEVRERTRTIERQQQQMMQAEKLQAIGTLASGVAHDFNNNLTGILGQASLLRERTDPGEELHRAAEAIEKAATHAAELTSQLLGFARMGKHRQETFDLHRIVDEVGLLIGRSAGKQIDILRRLKAEPSFVEGDPGQIQQVVLNLALNACHAMGSEGTLTLETATTDAGPADAPPELGPGRYVVLRVTDTGGGIPRAIRNRVFEPFFTTREPGEGTGMGLAMAYGAVHNHGGHITFDTEEGKGTTFHVFLPLAPEGSIPREEEIPAETAPVTGTGRILVVDDEEGVRDVLVDMLGFLGYDVSAVASGAEGVARYREQGPGIDLVIVDMAMPGMDGGECFRALREHDPGVRVLLSTGYALDGSIQALLNEGMAGFIKKPYRMHRISEAGAAILGPVADQN